MLLVFGVFLFFIFVSSLLLLPVLWDAKSAINMPEAGP